MWHYGWTSSAQFTMNRTLTIRRVADLLSLDITEIVKELGLGEGDKVCIARTARGFKSLPMTPS
jgi:hypothetical protein